MVSNRKYSKEVSDKVKYREMWSEEVERNARLTDSVKRLAEELGKVEKEAEHLRVRCEAQQAYIAALMAEKAKQEVTNHENSNSRLSAE